MSAQNGPGAVVRAEGLDDVSGKERYPNTTNHSAAPAWRHLVTVHRAADLFPMMPDGEIGELAKDIEANGQRAPLAVWRSMPGAEWQLLDGRNRVAAMARLPDGEDLIKGAIAVANQYESHVDPWAFVISANVRRRHLSQEQKRDLIAKVLKADPSRSNRSVAAITKTEHHTVSHVRNDLEGRGEITHVPERTDSVGRQQPASKPQPSKEQQLRAMREQSASPPPQRMTKEVRERVERERQAEANAVPIREGDEHVTRAAVRREIRNFIYRLGSLLTRTALIPEPERRADVLEIARLLGVDIGSGA